MKKKNVGGWRWLKKVMHLVIWQSRHRDEAISSEILQDLLLPGTAHFWASVTSALWYPGCPNLKPYPTAWDCTHDFKLRLNCCLFSRVCSIRAGQCINLTAVVAVRCRVLGLIALSPCPGCSVSWSSGCFLLYNSTIKCLCSSAQPCTPFKMGIALPS